MNSYIITSTGITIFFSDDNTQHTILNSHPRFAEICKFASNDDFSAVKDAIDMKATVDKFLYTSENGRFSINGGVLTFDGNAMHNTLTDRMINMAIAGNDISAMEKFMINLMENVSYRAVTELYGFLEAGNLPITSDGHFLAYKKIRDDYTDVHSGTMDNSIGSIVEMPRNQVNEDKNQTCSSGLHACSYDYLNSFWGSRVVVLKINPRDVVSVPVDYNDTKMRVCRYEVLREIEDWVGDRIEGTVSDDGWWGSDEEEDCPECEEFQSECVCVECDECGELNCSSAWCESPEGEEVEQEYTPVDDVPTATAERKLIRVVDQRNMVTYTFDTIQEAHDETKVPVEYIHRVLNKEAGSSMGFKFELVPADLG